MQKKKEVSQFTKWIKQSISLKLFTISILALALLIPSAMVNNIIHERSNLSFQANEEVRSKWAYSQNICAPILSVPIIEEVFHEEKTSYKKSIYHFLPDVLKITGNIIPKKLSRGIYEVIVYEGALKIEGDFNWNEDINLSSYYDIAWEEAFITVGISDLRGIKNDVSMILNGADIVSIPGSKINGLISSGLNFTINGLEESFETQDFSIEIQLQGSSNLSFIPLGKTTTIDLSSDWNSPSFMGSFLPDNRVIENSGFVANWNILQINRNFPQHWTGNAYSNEIQNSSFGVDFILPSDTYQKSIRSIKYALMNIALTFLIFFIVEVFTKTRIHPFQYIMVGLSIVLFYILLVSISEHLNFDQAYLISSTAVIGMIYLYSLSVFKSLKFSLYLLALSIINYGFIYITLQMTEYALLLGAAVMTIVLSLVMYTTRNIDWYKFNSINIKEEKIS